MNDIRSMARLALSLCGWLALLAVWPSLAHAGDARPADDRTLSPYFFVQGGDPNVDKLPLLGTHVEVAVSGVIADVTVTQVYKNDGTRPIHARYVFPASTRAAVHGMKMRVGDREIVAQIREKEQAKKAFEQAKTEGKTASLLEEERPNVFSMSVANVMPSDEIRVTLQYTELLVPTEGVYELVYPTVVGPRYSNQRAATAPVSDRWVASPYLRQGQAPTSSFEIRGSLSSGLPIAAVNVPSHKVTTTWGGKKLARFELDPSESGGGNRDFVLRYRLAGDAVQAGLSLFEKGGEKYFLAMVEPPRRVKPEQIPGREYVFVVDVSGSMHGFPLDTAKSVLKELVGALRPTDRFNVMFFSGGSDLMSPHSVPATPANVATAISMLESAGAGGGTELLRALQRALAMAAEPNYSRSFVVITDGYISAEREVFDHVRDHLGQANVFSLGIGSGVNRFLVEGIAKAGMGEPFVVTDASQSAETARRFRQYVEAPVLTGVRVRFDGFDAYDVEPKAIPDVLASRPVVVVGKWRGNPAGTLEVTGQGGSGAFSKKLDVGSVRPATSNAALPYLWARQRISKLVDFSQGRVTPAEQSEVTKLGLHYSLLTPYTSFIAVSHVVRNDGLAATDVAQPLPLPAGVSDAAVGDSMMGADEPELLWLLVLIAALGAASLLRRHGAMGAA